MKTIAVVVLLAVGPAFGQGNVTNPLGGLPEAYMEAIRIRNAAEAQRSLDNLRNAQAQAIRIQSEQLKLQAQQEQQQRHTSPQVLDAVPTAVFKSALDAVKKRYSDFDEYVDEAARLMGELDTSGGAARLNIEHYIEGMYLLAKHASFSNKAAPSPADALMRDPEFLALPIATRLRFVRAVAPEYARYSDEDMATVLSFLALKGKGTK